jgi:hypothetical protein
MTEVTETQAPVLLWEGQAAMYASPDGGPRHPHRLNAPLSGNNGEQAP